MSLLDHLKELRKRLLIIFVVVITGAIVSYNFSGVIFALLTNPYFEHFPANSLIGTGPAEPFILKLKVAVFSGILLMSPIIFYQLWLFIVPGLHDNERKMALPFVVITSALFLLGVTICYYTVLPLALAFFRGEYNSVAITPQIRISEHLSLMLRSLLAFGAIFEIPVITYFLAKLGLITHRSLIGSFRYAIVGIFVLAAVLTPTPDIFNQLVFTVPLIILYGISIIIAWAVTKN